MQRTLPPEPGDFPADLPCTNNHEAPVGGGGGRVVSCEAGTFCNVLVTTRQDEGGAMQSAVAQTDRGDALLCGHC